MSLSEGAVLGGYVLERRVAIGGMAEVWSASRVGDGTRRRYALKVLLDMFARDPKLRAMFADEATISQRLDHPNIIRVEGLIEEGPWMAQVMELVDGRDLRRVLQGVLKIEGRVPVPIAALIGREAARGLGYAHRALGSDGRPLGLVHRDVSPHNVMLDRRGRVAVLDFGVARARERLTVTTMGTVKGKLAYMAPEQMLGDEVDAQADVWSLGVVLWETLTLRRLFGAAADADLVHLVTRGRVEPVTAHRPDLPPRLADLVMRMLSHDPAARPAGMSAVESALSEVASGFGDAASPGALIAWAQPFMEPVTRKTGLMIAPAITAQDRPPVADLVDTSPPGAPTDATELPGERTLTGQAGRVAGAPTEAVALGGPTQATPIEDVAMPTEAMLVGDLGDLLNTQPEDRPHPPAPRASADSGPGYDVARGRRHLDTGEQMAPTLAQVARPQLDDESPTVLPTAPVRPPVPAQRPPLGAAMTPSTPLMNPQISALAPTPMTFASVLKPTTAQPVVPTPSPPTYVPSARPTIVWIAGGLVLGIGAMMLLARWLA